MTPRLSPSLVLAGALLALAGCANTEYLKSVDKANETRLALASADIKAQAADSMADEAGFNALAAATKSADPVTSAIAASQLRWIRDLDAPSRSRNITSGLPG